jgi:hypothetical protein
MIAHSSPCPPYLHQIVWVLLKVETIFLLIILLLGAVQYFTVALKYKLTLENNEGDIMQTTVKGMFRS